MKTSIIFLAILLVGCASLPSNPQVIPLTNPQSDLAKPGPNKAEVSIVRDNGPGGGCTFELDLNSQHSIADTHFFYRSFYRTGLPMQRKVLAKNLKPL